MKKLITSNWANKNYLAKIVKLNNIRKHNNADNLNIVTIDFQNIVIWKEYSDWDICIFFPSECQINKDFISHINWFRHTELNSDNSKSGFFEDNCRVKSIKLRWEFSLWFLIPIREMETFINESLDYEINQEFDYIWDIKICNKYEIIKNIPTTRNWKTEKRISRIVDGQFRFHVDTENLRRCPNVVSPDDIISITYKVHWTSAIYANVLTKIKLSWKDMLAKKLGISIQEEKYDILCSSRKVIKNEYETKDKNGFYDTDIWWEVKQEIKDSIPVWYTIYGEILGYTGTGKNIQAEYDYGCAHWSHKFMVYRITFTNKDGLVFELNTQEIRDFCERYWLTPVHLFYYWRAKYIFPDINTEDNWNNKFIKRLEQEFNGKNCFMCNNDVPEEWIVVRIEKNQFNFEAYKLKSFEFMEYESKQIDKNWDNLEW